MVLGVTDVVRVTGAGVSLAVLVHGDGPPVLFVHGFPFDHGMWTDQLAGLSGWRCIAPDLRGAGDSEAPADGYAMSAYAADLLAVCDALGVAPAVCCGFSMGGYVLFEFLRRYPERVRALILCNTKAEADRPEGRRTRDEQALLVERDGVEALAGRVLPRLLGPTTRERNRAIVERARAMVLRQPASGVVGALRAMRDRPDSTSTLGEITVPTLVVAGAEDVVAPPEVAREMAARIPKARFVEVEGAGHVAPVEQPERVTRALRAFLAELQPGYFAPRSGDGFPGGLSP
jgi:3-oxoadipate enol-lactonase